MLTELPRHAVAGAPRAAIPPPLPAAPRAIQARTCCLLSRPRGTNEMSTHGRNNTQVGNTGAPSAAGQAFLTTACEREEEEEEEKKTGARRKGRH
jgi:hypothetical protein